MLYVLGKKKKKAKVFIVSSTVVILLLFGFPSIRFVSPPDNDAHPLPFKKKNEIGEAPPATSMTAIRTHTSELGSRSARL
jgi:hypothetical protein